MEIKDLTIEIALSDTKNFAANRVKAEFKILKLIMLYQRKIRTILRGLEEFIENSLSRTRNLT
jgi:hypothetical protein